MSQWVVVKLPELIAFLVPWRYQPGCKEAEQWDPFFLSWFYLLLLSDVKVHLHSLSSGSGMLPACLGMLRLWWALGSNSCFSPLVLLRRLLLSQAAPVCFE